MYLLYTGHPNTKIVHIQVAKELSHLEGKEFWQLNPVDLISIALKITNSPRTFNSLIIMF